MKAKEIIIDIVKNRVAMMNIVKDNANPEDMERLRNELTGMMVCLKNLSSDDEFYGINYFDKGYEFGYYDSNHKWHIVESYN